MRKCVCKKTPFEELCIGDLRYYEIDVKATSLSIIVEVVDIREAEGDRPRRVEVCNIMDRTCFWVAPDEIFRKIYE